MAKIVVPTSGTVIASAWGKSVADALNVMHVQAGEATPITDAAGLVTVTFPVAFAARAFVTANVVGPSSTGIPYTALLVVTSATNFQAKIFGGNAAVISTQTILQWVAVGARA